MNERGSRENVFKNLQPLQFPTIVLLYSRRIETLSSLMCFQEDTYHSRCGHWRRKMYWKCSKTPARRWPARCWETITTGSVREENQCSTLRTVRTQSTAAVLSVSHAGGEGSKSIETHRRRREPLQSGTRIILMESSSPRSGRLIFLDR